MNIEFALPKDENIYIKNTEAIKKIYPHYYSMIMEAPFMENYKAVYIGKKRKLNIYDINRNQFYYDIDDPQEGVKNQIDQLEIRNLKIALILGFGLGYEAEYFSNNLAPKWKSKGCVIVERDLELFKIALKFFDLTPMIENEAILLILGEENNLLPKFEKFIRTTQEMIYFIKCIHAIFVSSSLNWFKDYYINIIGQIKDSVAYMLEFYGNDPHDSLIGIQNMLLNVDEIISNPGIDLLYEKFKDMPAVIVSTGPSLNKNKHLLKEVDGKAVILCPDASLRILLDMGIKPHFVTALERVIATAELIKGFKKEEVEEVYYTAAPVVMKEAYENYPGPRVIVYRNFDHFKWLNVEKGTLDIKHSSGNMAFKIAEALGCNPIILIGQDLAYSREGTSHAKGATLGEVQKIQGMDEYEVMGNDGEPILTTRIWDIFRKAYEVDISSSDKICINATEGGAKINGAELMTFRESIDKYIGRDINVRNIINQSISIFDKEESEKEKKQLTEVMDKTEKDLEFMIGKCVEAMDLLKIDKDKIEKALNSTKPAQKQIVKTYQKVMDIKGDILRTQPTMQLFVMHTFQSYSIKFEIDMNAIFNEYDDEWKAKGKILLMHENYFAVFHDILSISLNLLKDSRERVQI